MSTCQKGCQMLDNTLWDNTLWVAHAILPGKYYPSINPSLYSQSNFLPSFQNQFRKIPSPTLTNWGKGCGFHYVEIQSVYHLNDLKLFNCFSNQ